MRSLRAKALPYAATSLSLKTSSPGAIVKVLDDYAHYSAYALEDRPADAYWC
jgi:hypothetical protein